MKTVQIGKSTVAKKTFEVGKFYYTYSPIDEPSEFVGKYIGLNEQGDHVFENSKGIQMDVVFGVNFIEATEEQIKAFY